MTASPLKYLSDKVLLKLSEDVSVNRERYQSGDFLDLERGNGWAIEATDICVDYDLLKTLDGTDCSAAGDIKNSLILHQALSNMTPAFARDERVWVRLTHVECLDYSRKRWLSSSVGDRLDGQVLRHMFAPNRPAIRDDNAVSRLWWNYHIASIADPDDPESALRLILKTSDIRMQLVERPLTAARVPLARAIIRAMKRDPWVTSSSKAFRQFMITLNRDGGGLLFEVLADNEVDQFMDACSERARSHVENG